MTLDEIKHRVLDFLRKVVAQWIVSDEKREKLAGELANKLEERAKKMKEKEKLDAFMPERLSYGVGAVPETLVTLIVKKDDWDITYESHHIVFTNKDVQIRAWNSNRWFAWFNSGDCKNRKTGKLLTWNNEMPSRESIAKLRLYLSIVEKERVEEMLNAIV